MNDAQHPKHDGAAGASSPDSRGEPANSAGRNIVPTGERPSGSGPGARAQAGRAEQGRGPAEFSAHLFGQSGAKRGLKGGPPVLDAARTVYLETEYSGPNDRRSRQGRIRKTEI